jgi:hypothetical protein
VPEPLELRGRTERTQRVLAVELHFRASIDRSRGTPSSVRSLVDVSRRRGTLGIDDGAEARASPAREREGREGAVLC